MRPTHVLGLGEAARAAPTQSPLQRGGPSRSAAKDRGEDRAQAGPRGASYDPKAPLSPPGSAQRAEAALPSREGSGVAPCPEEGKANRYSRISRNGAIRAWMSGGSGP